MENGFAEKICEAVEYIVQQAVDSAPYDKTIQATIIKCVDSTIGQYQVKYQDSKFYAYSTNTETTYPNNALVYVLIPSNDMKREKTILGTVEKLGVDYAVNPEGEEAYQTVGKNCIEENNTVFEMCSYVDKYEQVLYDKEEDINILNINTEDLQEYITQSSSLICGGIFKTNLPKEQRFRGNYGILFELVFLDNASEELVTRQYLLDINQMTGNPYQLNNETRQYGIFKVDGANFQYLNKVAIFCYDFPNTAIDKPNDIFIKNIEISGAVPLENEELSGCALVFITPSGTYFDNNDLDSAVIKIQAQVRVKGKIIDKNSQNLKYYWFRENLAITTLSEKFNSYGGAGWECLNEYNLVKNGDSESESVVEWVPAAAEINIKKEDNLAKENRYKCVAIYNNDTILKKEIIIKNYSSNYDIIIDSDSGTQFYYDIGTPTLVCKINNEEYITEDFNYIWAEVDNNNNYLNLSETTEDNERYNNAKTNYDNLILDIQNEERLPAEAETELNSYKEIINEYNTITRIEKNKIFKIKVSEITNFKTYKCAVYYRGNYIGTAAITLINDLEKQDVYSLVINNGSQVFKYNEAGIAPTSDILEKPMILEPLSFTIFDNLGNTLDDSILEKCVIKWVVPTENTMISIPNSYIENRTEVDLINHTETYSNLLGISYKINESYNLKYTNNNIKLIVEYKGMNLVGQTDFTFVKEGEPGTNGTEFICKIVPNIADGIPPLYPMILNGVLNYTPKQANKWFKVQLWHNGVNIFENYQTGNSSENKTATVVWSILKNKYNANVSDNSDITIDATNGNCSYSGYVDNSAPANIIKCTITYDGITYYATMPIITAKTNTGYSIKLKDFTGFRYAIYTTDGRAPQYDNSEPFELEVLQNINGFNEDISRLTENYSVNYDWNIRGKIYNPVNQEWVLSTHLIEQDRLNLERNQKNFKPIDSYDGECLNNGLECIISRNDTELGRIHIPIHLMLNKYGNAAINGWDGNSVNVDKDGSGVILAPQIGAGQKENDNSFTGVLMGKVKESGKRNADIGFFGYKAGARTLFINSEDGSAIFGKSGNGQIIIDPNTDKALLYSSNYWKNYDEKGKPTNYSSTNENSAGMLIDLTTPQIKFGNGNFAVNSSGHLTAKGGGSIAGWTIGDTALTKGKVGISSNNTSDSSYAFWAGNVTAASAPFSVTFGGFLKAQEATIGKGTNKITIGKSSGNDAYSAIYSGSKSAYNANGTGFYIGTDGIALGRYSNNHSPFQVDSSGNLFSKAGTIGGYTIAENTLTGGTGNSAVGMSSKFGVGWAFWAGNDTPGNAPFRVGHEGMLYATDAHITGEITATSGSFTGSIEAGSGHVGGWNITTEGLTGGNTWISSAGSMGGPGWNINELGQATFNKVYITNSKGTSSLDWGNGFSVNSGGIMSASGANVSGTISASDGDIGAWTINGDGLISGNNRLYADGTFYMGTSGQWLSYINGYFNLQGAKAYIQCSNGFSDIQFSNGHRYYTLQQILDACGI